MPNNKSARHSIIFCIQCTCLIIAVFFSLIFHNKTKALEIDSPATGSHPKKEINQTTSEYKTNETTSKKESSPFPETLILLQRDLDMIESRELKVIRNKFLREWARNPDTERWEMKETNLNRDRKKKAWNDLDKLGFVNEFKPSFTQYEYAIILGSTVPTMIERFKYLVSQWKKGVKFRKLVFLTSQRPINKDIENISRLFNEENTEKGCSGAMYPHTEYEATIMIHKCIIMPDDMEKIHADFINTPRKFKSMKWVRPNTKEILSQWLKSNHRSGGKILAVSNQPYIPYQFSTMRSQMSSTFELEVVGPAIKPKSSLAIALDSVAQWLRYYNPRFEKNTAIEVRKEQ